MFNKDTKTCLVMKFLTNDTKMAELSKATHTEFLVKHCDPRISGAGKGPFMNKLSRKTFKHTSAQKT